MSTPTPDLSKTYAVWGRTLSVWRRKNDLSLADLGDAIGVTRQTIYLWEHGTKAPNDHRRVQLAQYFGVPVQVIFPYPEIEVVA